MNLSLEPNGPKKFRIRISSRDEKEIEILEAFGKELLEAKVDCCSYTQGNGDWNVTVWLEPKQEEKWITNIKDATEHPYYDAVSGKQQIAHGGSSICCTCQKKMHGVWDTVCASCGDTSCYTHSFKVNDGTKERWVCKKCRDLVGKGQKIKFIV